MSSDDDGADDPDGLPLHKVVPFRRVSRDEAAGLWRRGALVGLFNLQSAEIFAACRDFAIAAAPSERAAIAERAPAHARLARARESWCLRTRAWTARSSRRI